MRVLWVLNLVPPMIGEKLGEECSVKEGWISGILERVVKEESQQLELGICYPITVGKEEKKLEATLENRNIVCYQFCEDGLSPEKYDELTMIKRFRDIFQDFQPDILHIFGTEYGHSLAAAKAFGRPERILLGLQGIISKCAEEYMADLPETVYKKVTFRDWIKGDSMVKQQEKFMLRGEREKEAFLFCGNVTGRTAFDRDTSCEMNPHIRYFAMNETLRGEFFSGRWSSEACIPHRIFFSQADYPLKGFHYLLDALAILQKSYPDVTVSVAGNSLVKNKTLRDKIKRSAYGDYLLKQIRSLNMENRILFQGRLSAEEMKEQYLSCQTFVCASSLENSPNSVGEAMLLGVPTVAADTGGIPSILTHEKEGLLFEKGNAKELAKAIIRLWENPGLTRPLTEASRQRAESVYDGETNYRRLLEIYEEILNI